MADIVNLNRFRKRRDRADRDAKADANRRVHGRTKAEREEEATRRDRASRDIEGKRLDPTDPTGPTDPTDPTDDDGGA